MRYMTLYKPGRDSGSPPSERQAYALAQLIDDMTTAGALVGRDGLQASAKGARVRISNGRLIVTDGPFVETKELIAGFAILETASKAEAVEWAKHFLAVMEEGECEIRAMHENDECSAPQHGRGELGRVPAGAAF